MKLALDPAMYTDLSMKAVIDKALGLVMIILNCLQEKTLFLL